MSKVIVAVAAPVFVFFVAAALMTFVSGRRAALENSQPLELRPLNMRFHYGVDDVHRFWSALGRDGLIAEQRFLQFDLIFPALYGGGLAISLIWLSRRAAWPAGAVLVPVIIGVVADWTENLVQLEQLRLYVSGGVSALDPRAVQVASVATAIKLVAVGGAFALLLAAGVKVARRIDVAG